MTISVQIDIKFISSIFKTADIRKLFWLTWLQPSLIANLTRIMYLKQKELKYKYINNLTQILF